MTDQPNTQMQTQAEHAPCFDCLTNDEHIHQPWAVIQSTCRECISKQPKTCPRCGSATLVVDSTGSFHFSGGAVDDDVEDYLVCTECGEVIA